MKKLHRIIGDKNYEVGKFDLAIEHYFSSDLAFEEVMRLLYKLYKQDKQTEFALQMLKYFKILLGKLESSREGRK